MDDITGTTERAVKTNKIKITSDKFISEIM